MLIETTIPLRKDGTVRLTCASGNKYEFRDNGTGTGAAEIGDEGDIRYALNLQEFYPADDADHDAAERILTTADEPEPDEGPFADMSQAALKDHLSLLTGEPAPKRIARDKLIDLVIAAEARNELDADDEPSDEDED